MSGLNITLMYKLSQLVGNYVHPKYNMMMSIAHRVTAGLAAAVRDKAARDAKVLCASGQCAAAIVPLQQAIDLGHLPSRALYAWLLFDGGRVGVPEDLDRACKLVEEASRLGCPDCQGVMARCHLGGIGCVGDDKKSLELAQKSSEKNSMYGHLVLSTFYEYGRGCVRTDFVEADRLERLAAKQKLDMALFCQGVKHAHGFVAQGLFVAKDYKKALQLWQQAAAQGFPAAMYWIADCYEHGHGVAADVAEAISWYRRALAAGYINAAIDLRMLEK
jgi:TPR repeat protein